LGSRWLWYGIRLAPSRAAIARFQWAESGLLLWASWGCCCHLPVRRQKPTG
jgi:hypothetical protein